MNSANIDYELKEDKNEEKEKISIYGKKNIKNKKNYFLIKLSIFIISFLGVIFFFIYIIKKSKYLDNKIFEEENNYEMISDKNNIFNISFQKYHDFIKINAYSNIKFLKEEYEKIIFLKEAKYDKYLSLCDSISEVYKQLIYEFEKNSLNTLLEYNNEIKIIIPVKYISAKSINITISKKLKSDKEISEELLKQLENLNEKYNDLKEKNKIFQKIIKFFKKNENFDKINSSSSIINNDILKILVIIEFLQQEIKKNFSLELIFKMSKNGDTSKDFHKYCDNKGPTLSLIQTTDNKIFGGFTPLNWNSSDPYETLRDESGLTFLFSLNLLKKYNLLNKEEDGIRNDISNGPIFGNYDFGLRDNLKEGRTYANSKCNFFSNNNLELIDKEGDNEFFQIKEFEVFRVIY